jgi:putative nucleotidyltransferase with HDIG domain
MSATLMETIRERVQQIETMPAIQAVFLPLLQILNDPGDVRLDEVVRLVSYDNTIAAQCLRVASSPLFGLPQAPKSIKAAVISLGLRRVETILLTCCLGQAFPAKNWILDPSVFWRHSLGCAMVCRKFAEKLSRPDGEKVYMAGLLHDIGLIVNSLIFPKEFAAAFAYALKAETPLDQAERATMSFTHCESGRALAERWNLAPEIVEVISFHHTIERAQAARSMVALVHLSDLLCRMRGLGYGYYEREKVDWIRDPAWLLLAQEHRELQDIDLVRFSFELDEAVNEIQLLVNAIFSSKPS